MNCGTVVYSKKMAWILGWH